MTEDKPFCWGELCYAGKVYPPPFAPQMVPLLLRKEARRDKCNWYECQLGGLILSQPSADSSLCGGSHLGKASADAGFRLCGGEAVAFRSPPPPLRPPLMSLYRFRRWQVAAALSAAVTTAELQGIAPNSQAEPSKRHRLTPNASRSSGGGLGEALLSEKRPPPASPPTCL